mmetsp:Transcript_44764/g.90301  ORF Transcript_44764/g.90301 Transcript_44764/m.90301 type:complete len:181 (-) Transcript_44764:109-651(-)
MGWDSWLKKIAPELVPDEPAASGETTAAAVEVPIIIAEANSGIVAQSYGALSTVTVDLGMGFNEAVQVDSKRGPKVLMKGGGSTFVSCSVVPWHAQRRAAPSDYGKDWDDMTITERTVILDLVARKNVKLREWQEAEKIKAARKKREVKQALPWDKVAPPTWLSWSAEKRLDAVAQMSGE